VLVSAKTVVDMFKTAKIVKECDTNSDCYGVVLDFKRDGLSWRAATKQTVRLKYWLVANHNPDSAATADQRTHFLEGHCKYGWHSLM
jgi:hypothetical protein